MKFLQNLKDRKKKKLRQLNLSDTAWIQLGEIYSHVLINKEKSLSNEEIIQMSLEHMHKKIVRKGRFD